jgi:hypothetical protein
MLVKCEFSNCLQWWALILQLEESRHRKNKIKNTADERIILLLEKAGGKNRSFLPSLRAVILFTLSQKSFACMMRPYTFL